VFYACGGWRLVLYIPLLLFFIVLCPFFSCDNTAFGHVLIPRNIDALSIWISICGVQATVLIFVSLGGFVLFV